MAARVFFYLLTLLSLICEVTESNLAAAASTFHFVDRHWLHKAVIKPPHPPSQRVPERRWARTGTSRLVWKVLHGNWSGSRIYTRFFWNLRLFCRSRIKPDRRRRGQRRDMWRWTTNGEPLKEWTDKCY